jgi:hypothetical protein
MISLLLVPWILLPGCPHQQDKQPEAKVKVTIVVILASDRCRFVDRQLNEVATEVQKLDPSLTGFKLVSMTVQSLPVNEKTSFACVEGCTIDVVVHQCADKMNKVCLALTAPLQGEILCRCVCGKFLPIMTRYQTREKIPPLYLAAALAHLCGRNPVQQLMALETLDSGRTRDRLILAIRVQPCNGK